MISLRASRSSFQEFNRVRTEELVYGQTTVEPTRKISEIFIRSENLTKTIQATTGSY